MQPIIQQLLRGSFKPFRVINHCIVISLAFATLVLAQDDAVELGDIDIPVQPPTRCFGVRDISEPRALAICNALYFRERVKARELSEQWVRTEPDSAAAQYALAEVLLTVEGNMPRALFHLNRAEQLTGYTTMEEAIQSDNFQWHYLTLVQLSSVHQLLGDQHKALAYLDQLESIYGEDMESSRGWPLIKLKEYELARASANRVLQTADDEWTRSSARNTLCAVELASLAPLTADSACDRVIDEEGNITDSAYDSNTVYLTNASEVALSMLEMGAAESLLDRATKHLNPYSYTDPWIYKLYLTLNQGRFDDAYNAHDGMMVWYAQQEPLVSVGNLAEHFLVSASFLLIAGYAEDAAKLSMTALNQPDRNGASSTDDAQKDAYAALLNHIAARTELEIQREKRATMGILEATGQRLATAQLALQAWRSARRAAALFADFEVLQNRVRPYAPLDVNIPEWIEPEIISLIGTGVMTQVLEQARTNGAFQLNNGYYYAYLNEIAAVDGNAAAALETGGQALTLLPTAEVMLRARIAANMAQALQRQGNDALALSHYQQAYTQDPSIIRRLGLSLPATIASDGGQVAELAADYLRNSPRFDIADSGFTLDIRSTPDYSICLRSTTGEALTCYTHDPSATEEGIYSAAPGPDLTRYPASGNPAMDIAGNPATDSTPDFAGGNPTTETAPDIARDLVDGFHTRAFGLGYDISRAQRSFLLGSSVYLNAQQAASQQRDTPEILTR